MQHTIDMNKLLELSGPALVELHNSLLEGVAPPVKKFRNKDTAVERTLNVLERFPEKALELGYAIPAGQQGRPVPLDNPNNGQTKADPKTLSEIKEQAKSEEKPVTKKRPGRKPNTQMNNKVIQLVAIDHSPYRPGSQRDVMWNILKTLGGEATMNDYINAGGIKTALGGMAHYGHIKMV